MQQIHGLIEQIQNQLALEYKDPVEANQYAWWLLEALTGLKKINLIEQSNFNLTDQQDKKLQNWLHKLVSEHMPLQYLLGFVPFDGVEILTKKPVLIPRPETEEWVTRLCQQLEQLPNNNICILDLCTGSGCIAIALAKKFPHATVYATDIANEAMHLTQENSVHNNINNIKIIRSDLFQEIPTDLKFDLIVGNPPYISPDEWQSLEPSVTRWEDRRALLAPDNGLGIIKQIIKEAPKFLKPNSQMLALNIAQLVLEIGHTQAHKVRDYMEHEGYCSITIGKDLEGKDRTVSARVVPCGYLSL